MKYLLIIFFVATNLICQNNTNRIFVEDFDNSARHWYYINDSDKIIYPQKGQKRYSETEIEKIADNILLFQKENGGWAKNYDMLAVLTDKQKDTVILNKNKTNTCFDNGTTWGQLKYLATAYNILKKNEYKNGFIKGVKFILNAQYDNGGFPQFYPDTTGYAKHITFNDGAMIGVMRILKKINDKDSIYNIVGDSLYNKVQIAYKKGIDCILKTQINNNGKITAWCQQHHYKTLMPVKARSYEIPSICNMESAEIVEFLMSIDNPTEQIKQAIENTIKWFNESKLEGFYVKTIKAERTKYRYSTIDTDRIIVKDKNAPPIWARFYDLETYSPVFCNRDGHVVNTFEEIERERRVGYKWFVYEPEEAIKKYKIWKNNLTK
jgi:PelA/Pel-15E family pectate lyase